MASLANTRGRGRPQMTPIRELADCLPRDLLSDSPFAACISVGARGLLTVFFA
jgi:hypothetical protein